MALGGTAGVRGYREGEVYGDDGWRVLFDLNAPPIQIGEFATEEISDRVPAMIRCSVFTDYGTAYLIDRPTTSGLSYSQWGTGAGFFLTAGQHFYARLTMAWALKSTVLTPAGSAQAYFSVGWQF
jgi:hemolysin activation/secretion protein